MERYRLKVGIVVRILWSAGTPKFSTEDASTLREKGPDVTLIFCGKTKNDDVNLLLIDGLNYKIIEESDTSKFVWSYNFFTGIFISNRCCDGRFDYNLAGRHPNYIKDMNLDYLLCQAQWASLGRYYRYKKRSIRYVVIFHIPVNNLPSIKGMNGIFLYLALRFQKEIIIHASRISTETESIARAVRKFYNGEFRVTFNFSGLTDNVIRNYSKKQNKISLISFWNEVKMAGIYIYVFKELYNYKFTRVWNRVLPEYNQKSMDKLKTDGVMDKVSLLGSISEVQKILLLKEKKIFVWFGQDELWPGYGNIKVGIPIICNSSLGVAEYLENYTFARVLEDINNTDKLNQFIELVDNEEIYDSTQSDIDKIIVKYSWHKHTSRLVQEIGSVQRGINNNR